MTQEDKELLLKDLCVRLPYGIKAQILNGENIQKDVIISTGNIAYIPELGKGWFKECKPYLFPLSSMTEQQKSYLYFNTKFEVDRYGDLSVTIDEDGNYFYTDMSDYTSLIDWLNKNHFDYRGLIEKGLAIDATGKGIY